MEREASAAATAVEGAATAHAAEEVVTRLRQVEAEREVWLAKRHERLARKEQLRKLLGLEAAKQAAGGPASLLEAQDEGVAEEKPSATAHASPTSNVVVMARKKELQKLQERARLASEVRSTQPTPAVKRKRNEEPPAGKKPAALVNNSTPVPAAITEMHECRALDEGADRIQALIEVEKQAVAGVCDPLRSLERQHSNSATFRDLRRQAHFLSSLLGDTVTKPGSLAVSAVLAACAGVDALDSPACDGKRASRRSHYRQSGVFGEMETWLREQAEIEELTNSTAARMEGSNRLTSGSSGSAASSNQPFSLEEDSIVKQLRTVDPVLKRPRTKFDPMKMLCHYELNGVCNDANCSYQHQKDYQAVENEGDEAPIGVEKDTNGQDSKELQQLLLAFAEFRANIMKKWPLITSTVSPSTASESAASPNPIQNQDATLTSIAAETKAGSANEESSDFLALDLVEEEGDALPTESRLDARYYEDPQATKVYGEALQKRVEEQADDTDAWLLLALDQLELDVASAETSGNSRPQQQLVALCSGLNVKARDGASSGLVVNEANLKRCLHTLSRALEVEANAYCEAVWLLYLHLCRQLTSRQTELDTAEQAVQFLPKSHALWLRYLSTYEFDSVKMAEEVHWRILQHLGRVETGQDGVVDSESPAVTAELSILLTAICLHLCLKLWRAGAEKRALDLLAAFVQLEEPVSSEFAWCDPVRRRLRTEETIGLSLIFAHLATWHEMPVLVEQWLAASSCQGLPMKEFASSVESFRLRRPHGRSDTNDEDLAQALKAYELAFRLHQDDCPTARDAGNAILNNWLLILTLQEDKTTRDEVLKSFLKEKLAVLQQYPAVSLSAAKLVEVELNDPVQSHQLMLTMMDQSSATQFPEALHYFLLACRQFSELFGALDEAFPHVMGRLASGLDVETDTVEQSVQEIKRDSNRMSKSIALQALLHSLLTCWIDQLAMLDDPTQSPPDIYVALDICHLMGTLLDPSTAIDSLQKVLSSPKFAALSLKARQLVWKLRFVFQIDQFQQKDAENSRAGHKTKLIQLFRHYLGAMRVETEILRQTTRQVASDLNGQAIQDAVCSSLYPERRQLVTYEATLELFELCCAAVPRPEQAAFFASFTDVLALVPEFSLAFSGTLSAYSCVFERFSLFRLMLCITEVAVHDWEVRAARASLRRCLTGSKTLLASHSRVLQALVAVELRQKSMKAVSSLLASELQADPLLLETWRLVLGMEILLGEQSAARAEELSADLAKRQLVFSCNTYGDTELLGLKTPLLESDAAISKLNLRGLGLQSVPNAVLLHSELKWLCLSGNQLTDLPIGLGRLKELETLIVSENALLELPASVGQLTGLKTLSVAHNNLSIASMLLLSSLPLLEAVDLRWNALTRLPVTTLTGFRRLKVLRLEGNSIPTEELEEIKQQLAKRQAQDGDTEAKAVAEQAAALRPAQPEESSTEQSAETSRPEPEAATAEGEAAEDVEMLAVEPVGAGVVSEAKDTDGDQIMEPNEVIDLEGATTKSSEHTVQAIEQSKKVIDVDGADSVEEGEVEAQSAASKALEDKDPRPIVDETQAPTVSDAVASAALEAFAQIRVQAAAEAAERLRVSQAAPQVAFRKLRAYMEAAQITRRTEVRERNPELWREFVAANVPLNSRFGKCRVCCAPNDGRNQRLNTMVLCVPCLEQVLLILKAQDGPEETKEGN
ncbi:hypothetical protein BBJ28_00011658 [Nothophytophthora sp. Chile5]|nr:hypothetical protein BBJ28_00011658 [Nothophytophthora sp. Chile5]